MASRSLFIGLISILFWNAVASLNPIQIENSYAGTTNWILTNPPNPPNSNYTYPEIEGYINASSVKVGDTISFYVSTTSSTYGMVIYRMGYYNGTGARQMIDLGSSFVGQLQPVPTPIPVTLLADCNWNVTSTFTIPSNFTSGFYLVKLTASGGKQNYMIFVVRNDTYASPYLMPGSILTWQAQNNWRGYSLDVYNNDGLYIASRVSFNRPYGLALPTTNTLLTVGTGQFFGWEYNMVRWLEKNGYDVTYCSNFDFHFSPMILLSHYAIISAGRDHYYTSEMKHNLQYARDMGVFIGAFTAANIYYQVRMEPSAYNFASYRTIAFLSQNDPLQNVYNPNTGYLMTTDLFESAQDGEADLNGNCDWVGYDAVSGYLPNITIINANHWLCSGTGLVNGDQLYQLVGPTFSAYQGIASYQQHAPQGVSAISNTSFNWQGPSYPTPDAFSTFIHYTAKSGARVVNAGTIGWTSALDNFTVGGFNQSGKLDTRAQLMTSNFLNRAVPASTGVGYMWMFNGTSYNVQEDIYWRSSWRSIIPGYFLSSSNRSDLFFYDPTVNPLADGVFYSVSATGSLTFQYQIELNKTYKFIIPGKWITNQACLTCDQLLLYDGISGNFTIYIPDPLGSTNGIYYPLFLSTYGTAPTQYPGKEWDIMVPGHYYSASNVTDLLLYDRIGGEIWIYENADHGYLSLLSRTTGVSKTWSQIIPGQFSYTSPYTSLMFYDIATNYNNGYHQVPADSTVGGCAQFYTVTGSGNLTTLGSLNTGYRNEWTTIISGSFYPTSPTGLSYVMFYDPTVGETAYYYADGSGGLVYVSSPSIASSGISLSFQIIAPMLSKGSYNNLFIYDANSYTPISS